MLHMHATFLTAALYVDTVWLVSFVNGNSRPSVSFFFGEEGCSG